MHAMQVCLGRDHHRPSRSDRTRCSRDDGRQQQHRHADWAAVLPEAGERSCHSTSLCTVPSVLLLTRQGRLYRVLDAFSWVEYQMIVSQMVLMLSRNLLYLFLLLHIVACGFYYMGR